MACGITLTILFASQQASEGFVKRGHGWLYLILYSLYFLPTDNTFDIHNDS